MFNAIKWLFLVGILGVVLMGCGHQEGNTGPSPQPSVQYPTTPPAESNNQGVSACPEKMHEVVTSIWGLKSCVND